MKRLTALVVCVVCVRAAIAGAQTTPPPAPLGDWPLEQVRLRSGKTLRGLVVPAGPDAWEVVQVRQPPGEPMYLLVGPSIAARDIAEMQRLDATQRKKLEARIHHFRNRAKFLAGRMEEVALTKKTGEAKESWEYRGRWFALESTADEAVTRRAIVRVEQMFRAFRQVLPPRREPEPQRLLRIVVYGSRAPFERHIEDLGIDIRNPAFYHAEKNVVVAGSELRGLADQVAKAHAEHARLRRQLAEYDRELPSQLRKLDEELAAGGFEAAEREQFLAATRQKWRKQRVQRIRRIAKANRENAAALDHVVQRMLRTLYHEAFHAYLENYVYPGRDWEVPRWLNEGLAQVFEGGMLEADSLRIDAPNREALERLQTDLSGERPLPLADLLAAEPAAFLLPHREGRAASSRHYRYSWGLAYDLTFEVPRLATDAMDRYVSTESPHRDPIARFEHLVGMPLAEFEHQWQQRMKGLGK